MDEHEDYPLFPATGYVPCPETMEQKEEKAKLEIAFARNNRKEPPFVIGDTE